MQQLAIATSVAQQQVAAAAAAVAVAQHHKQQQDAMNQHNAAVAAAMMHHHHQQQQQQQRGFPVRMGGPATGHDGADAAPPDAARSTAADRGAPYEAAAHRHAASYHDNGIPVLCGFNVEIAVCPIARLFVLYLSHSARFGKCTNQTRVTIYLVEMTDLNIFLDGIPGLYTFIYSKQSVFDFLKISTFFRCDVNFTIIGFSAFLTIVYTPFISCGKSDVSKVSFSCMTCSKMLCSSIRVAPNIMILFLGDTFPASKSFLVPEAIYFQYH
nr:unnamed protein product [Callosobruchus analis]